MFKELRQRIGQGLTASSDRSPVTHGQVGRADFCVILFLVKFHHHDTANRTLTAATAGEC